MELKTVLVIILIAVTLLQWRVLPESMRQQCVDHYHQAYLVELGRIDNLALDGKIMRELKLIAVDRYIEQLEDRCNVNTQSEVLVQK